MEKRRTNAQTKSNSSAKPRDRQCNQERTSSESDVCPVSGRSLYDNSSSVLGWIAAAEYAYAKATSEEIVINAISRGDLDGRLISGTWYVLCE